MVVTGRTLEDGEPVPGTGFEVEVGSRLWELLEEREGPVRSHPTRPAWSAPLDPVDGDGDRTRILSIFGAGYTGPPEHYHEVSDERFDIRQGTFTFEVGGRERTVAAGETLTVPTGTRHTFGYDEDNDELGVSVTDIEPLGRIGHVIPSLAGIAHDAETSHENRLQQAVIADRLAEDTVFVEAESGLNRVLTELLAPVGKAAGYQAAYARHRQPAFWEARVEQPDF
jgi:mannose-6-phosphate isomerase-like protein (cupin superfamily)